MFKSINIGCAGKSKVPSMNKHAPAGLARASHAMDA